MYVHDPGIRDTDDWTYDDDIEFWVACEIHEKIQYERGLSLLMRL